MADSNNPNKGTTPAGGPWQEREAKISREILRRSERAAHGVSADDLPEEKSLSEKETKTLHELHADDKAIILTVGGAAICAGLFGIGEGWPVPLDVAFLSGGIGVMAPISPYVRSHFGWLSHRAALWAVAISTWLFLGIDIGLKIWPIASPLTGIEQQAKNLPKSPSDLAPGTVWNNGGVLSVVPLTKPTGSSPPEIYPGVTYPRNLGAYIREDVSEGSYEAGYENATVFWNRDSSIFYILSASTQTWIEQRETSAPPPEYYRSVPLKKMFPDTPKGKLPPYAGIAKLWQNDPKKWRTLLGWRDWNCALEKTHFQEFENGYVIGVLFNSPNPAADRGLIWILYKDGGWDQQQLGAASAPVCNPLN